MIARAENRKAELHSRSVRAVNVLAESAFGVDDSALVAVVAHSRRGNLSIRDTLIIARLISLARSHCQRYHNMRDRYLRNVVDSVKLPDKTEQR